MTWLIDTCTLSEPMRAEPDAKVLGWLSATDEARMFLSVLTLGELEKGVAKLKNGKRRAALARWLADDLPARFSGRILSITPAVAARWGRLSAAAEAAGRPLPVVDGLIGATALEAGLTVVTRNTRDLVRTGAPILDPWR